MPKYLQGVKKKNGQNSVPADDMSDIKLPKADESAYVASGELDTGEAAWHMVGRGNVPAKYNRNIRAIQGQRTPADWTEVNREWFEKTNPAPKPPKRK